MAYPPGYDKRHDCPEEFIWLLEAYGVLSGSRQVGMEVGNIPLSEIVAYCKLYVVPDVHRLVAVTRHLDGIFIGWHRDRRPAN